MEDMEKGALTETVFYILLSLFTPLHGYGIMQKVKAFSKGRVELGAGTLYGALNTLLERGWIQSASSLEPSRKKDYIITSLGKDALRREMTRLEELLANGRTILKAGGTEK
jgi:DNA-binding PadR family transcriptional regulator